MRKPTIVEIAPFWKRADGAYTSAPLMDDRAQDLLSALQEGPVKLMLRPNNRKRSPKSPDSFLLAISIPSKRSERR